MCAREKDMYYSDNNGTNLSFTLQKDIKIYEPDERVSYSICGKTTSADIQVNIEFTSDVFNLHNAKNYQISPFSSHFRLEGNFIPSKCGCYSIILHVINSHGYELFSDSIKIGVMNSVLKPENDGFLFGIHSFIFRVFRQKNYVFENTNIEETYERTWKYLDRLGVNLIREGDTWSGMQPEKDKEVDFIVSNRIIADACDRDILVNWHVGAAPRWALKEKYNALATNWPYPPKLKLWIDFFAKLVDHYKNYDNIIYEIFNEPNWEFWRGEAEEYVELLTKTAEVVKNIAPRTQIIPGGMVPKGDKDKDIYYKSYRDLLDIGLIDNIAYHCHGVFPVILQAIDYVKEFANRYDISIDGILLNESGVWSKSDVEQAQENIKKLLWAMANEHKAFVLYALRADKSPEWAILNQKGEPRLTFIAYGSAINFMGNAIFEGQLIKHDVYLYSFKKHNKRIITAFSNTRKAEIVIGKSVSYMAYDYLGNLKSSKGELVIDSSPVYVIVDDNLMDLSDVRISVT